MTMRKVRIDSGVPELDRLLNGLYIGDNVIWYDDAGSLAPIFCQQFIRASLEADKYLIYISFDRSPRNLLDKLGSLVAGKRFILLDCFTYGKGDGSDVFLRFYDQPESALPCRVIRVNDPRNVAHVMQTFYSLHETLSGDVRFVFESLTGMQQLWDGEENLVRFYSHSCPRLYELNTVAYWVIEKNAHSQKLKARINQIAQVAIDLSIRRGKTRITVLKAENRNIDNLNKPLEYWRRDPPDQGFRILMEPGRAGGSGIDLGMRLRELRTRRGLSQSELARQVGVTPSNISQVENNLIYPSLPALIKMAEILSIDTSAFFQDTIRNKGQAVFPGADALTMASGGGEEQGCAVRRLVPIDLDPRAEPHMVEIAPGADIGAHFFVHKGEEMGYLIAGRLEMTLDRSVHPVAEGDVIYLTTQIPTRWRNPGKTPARMLWMKIR